ncbi:hypothetical protein FA15DRAFT_655873 [Coprinopsis marcescibilis]|uniref:Uncharacterized protein n=1 Tax=Coprinopsis marcescibilis TaxID=230819 RepID=A0A5C3KUW1_COPMA|nr:hypothetical protein FA15DRAFT_655873 [Coprinopsis marcescibilis]
MSESANILDLLLSLARRENVWECCTNQLACMGDDIKYQFERTLDLILALCLLLLNPPPSRVLCVWVEGLEVHVCRSVSAKVRAIQHVNATRPDRGVTLGRRYNKKHACTLKPSFTEAALSSSPFSASTCGWEEGSLRVEREIKYQGATFYELRMAALLCARRVLGTIPGVFAFQQQRKVELLEYPDMLYST